MDIVDAPCPDAVKTRQREMKIEDHHVTLPKRENMLRSPRCCLLWCGRENQLGVWNYPALPRPNNTIYSG